MEALTNIFLQIDKLKGRLKKEPFINMIYTKKSKTKEMATLAKYHS